jgi:hypothetical protein
MSEEWTPPQVTVKRDEVENHREGWAKVAKEHGWHTDPFYVQFWVFTDGTIRDCVSFKGMTHDIFILITGNWDDYDETADITNEVITQ